MYNVIFSELEKNRIHLDGAYLDVFTCNEGDECNNPRHRMTRRECYDYRARCFDYLMSKRNPSKFGGSQ